MFAMPARLSLRELAHDWRASLCFVAALVGVMAPLLVVLALKNGVLGTLIGRLVEDPSNRELIAVGAGRHEAAFFATLSRRDDVAFVVPATRSINGVANAVRRPGARQLERAVPILPSAPGDPLLDAPPVTRGEVQATVALLDALGAQVGDSLELIIERSVDGVRQSALAELEVVGAVPIDRYARPALFLSLPDVLAVEAFRDDPAIAPATWRDPRPEPQAYASFRLYAAHLEDLAGLERDLAAMGVEVRPRAQNATLLLDFRRKLNLLYAAIAALAIAGFWAATAANLRGMVERQRISFSLLRLVAMPDGQRRLVPLIQSLVLVLGGTLAALLLVLPFLLAINRGYGAPSGESIAFLGPVHVAATLGVGLLTAVTASLWAVRAIDAIQTDEVVRHA